MTSYIFFHNEWTDICLLEYKTNKIKRTTIDNEYGTFIINENEIIIKWDKWDPENIFVLIDNKYYLKDSFKISKFIYDCCETYYTFNYDNKIIFKENDNLTKILKGTYIFNNKLLLVKWNNTNIYKKYIFIESKNIYINESFVNKVLIEKNIFDENDNLDINIFDNDIFDNDIFDENDNLDSNNLDIHIDIINEKEIIDIKIIEENILLNNINNYKLTTLNDLNIRYSIKLLENENYEKIDIEKLNVENINYIDFDNIEKYKDEILFNKNKLYNDFYSINLPFKIPEKNTKIKTVLTLSEWGYPAFGGGENWLIDMSKMLIEENYEVYLICFSDVFNNESFKETKYINFDKIHIIQMEKNIQNILKLVKLINPDIINHQGINRLYYMKIANLLNIPFITGFCFWQNIIQMNLIICFRMKIIIFFMSPYYLNSYWLD